MTPVLLRRWSAAALVIMSLGAVFVSGRAGQAQEASPTVPNILHAVAVLQGLDKANARVATFEVPVGELATFGTLSLFIRTCRKTPPEDYPESAIFIEIHDQTVPGTVRPYFQGWMFSSSPSLSALDHPIYDVWLKDCKNPVSSTDSEGSESE